MRLTVECYSGRKADERPVRFWLNGNLHQVDSVIDQWYEPARTYYKVRASDGDTYILRLDTSTPEGAWDLVSYRRDH
jgi:hypothetical protein